MAYEVGTATNMEDFFTKALDFLTLNPELVAQNRQWEILRVHRDNLESVTTNLVQSAAGTSTRLLLHTFRMDPRTLNTDDLTALVQGGVTLTSWVAGTSFVSMVLREARVISSVRIASPNNSNATQNLQNFRLQYSDDGSSWTTTLTVTGGATWTVNEVRTFPVTEATAHKYWRILLDTRSSTGTTGSIGWKSFLLYDEDGQIANNFGSEVLLKASGNSGTESIYTGMRTEYEASSGWYNLFVNGYTGYNPSETSWFEQPGAIPGSTSPTFSYTIPMVPLWNSAIPYWFSASGRSFRFCAKVSTSYESGYMGFILPYSTPGQYPYPLAVGGCMTATNTGRLTDWRYSSNRYGHSNFTCPGSEGSYTTQGAIRVALYIRDPGGIWQGVAGRYAQSGNNPNTQLTMTQSMSFPYSQAGAARAVWPASTRGQAFTKDYREILGGGYLLQPNIIHQRLPAGLVYGEFEGIFSISGFANSAENTLEWNGETHVVFQNIARTEVHEYWTMALPE